MSISLRSRVRQIGPQRRPAVGFAGDERERRRSDCAAGGAAGAAGSGASPCRTREGVADGGTIRRRADELQHHANRHHERRDCRRGRRLAA